MKRTLLPLILASATLAQGQGRASAEAFIARTFEMEQTGDADGLVASLDPTLIWRWKGELFTYPDIKAGFEAFCAEVKRRPAPTYVAPGALSFQRLDIVGQRAILDEIHRLPKERPEDPTVTERAHIILTWRDGGWRIWRLDVLPPTVEWPKRSHRGR